MHWLVKILRAHPLLFLRLVLYVAKTCYNGQHFKIQGSYPKMPTGKQLCGMIISQSEILMSTLLSIPVSLPKWGGVKEDIYWAVIIEDCFQICKTPLYSSLTWLNLWHVLESHSYTLFLTEALNWLNLSKQKSSPADAVDIII